MAKQKVNIVDPKTEKRRCGCLDTNTKRVKLSDDREYSEEYLKRKGDISYFETRSEGKIIQKIGKFLGL